MLRRAWAKLLNEAISREPTEINTTGMSEVQDLRDAATVPQQQECDSGSTAKWLLFICLQWSGKLLLTNLMFWPSTYRVAKTG